MLSLVLLQVTSSSGGAAMATSQDFTYFQLLFKGGVIVIPILLLSLLSVYLMFERYFEIRRHGIVDKPMLADFNTLLQKGDREGAKKLLQTGNGSMNRIMMHAMANIDKPVREIEGAIELVSQTELNLMNRNLNYLGLIAGIAPMLGFVGTILGVIKIFYNISMTDNISIGIISEGLYMKMISSCLGLMVGIIAFSGYHILAGMVSRFTSKVEAECLLFFKILNKTV
jgi:biopolymer transport protein ExbB